MPYREREIKKVYWTASDAARAISNRTNKIHPSTVRYWTKKFPDFVSPKRSRKGDRLYNEYDIQTLLVIRNLLYYEKFTVEGALRQMKMFSSDKVSIKSGINYTSGDVISIDGRLCKINSQTTNNI